MNRWTTRVDGPQTLSSRSEDTPPAVSDAIPLSVHEAMSDMFYPEQMKDLWSAINEHALVSIADPAGNIIFANDTFVRISGYSRAELIGQNHRVLKSDVHGTQFWEAMWKTISSGYAWSDVVCNRAKDGSHYWVKSQISPFFGTDGKIEKYVSIRTDITALKMAQDELEISRSLRAANHALKQGKLFLRATLDNLPFEFWLKDAQGRYLVVNQVFVQALDYLSPEEVAGLTDIDLWSADQAMRYQAVDAKVLQSRATHQREEFDASAGCWREIFIKPLLNASGEVLGTVGYCADISERKVVQHQLQSRTEQLDAIFSVSPDGIVAFDVAGRVVDVSPAFTSMTGIDAAQARDLNEAQFTQLLAQRCLIEPVAGRVGSGADGEVVDLRSAHRRIEVIQGGKRLLDMSRCESRQADLSLVLYFHDVTHQAAIESLKSEFLTTAAHELRTPMTTIYGYSEVLCDDQLDESNRREAAKVVHQQAQRVVSILNDMLDLAVLEQHRGRDMQWRCVAVAPMLCKLVQEFKPSAGRSGPQLLLSNRQPLVWGDAAKMEQAVLNLLVNAYKYSPDGGAVHLALLEGTASMSGASLVGISVVDSGIGISAQQQARMFDRFYRADDSGKNLGTGLGLSLVKEIVELHGGRVDVRSEPGMGTTVTLWLPQYQDSLGRN